MKRFGVFVVLAMALQVLNCAKVTRLPPEQQKALEDSSRFHEVLSTTNLPPAIVALCADDSGRLAEPDQKWAVTDVITDASLPRKRLIWAAVSGKQCVVHYELGGRGHSFHILIATLAKADAKAKVVWRGVGDKLKDYAAFLAVLRSGKLDDMSSA